jgi:MarR family transcriptional regulator, organic hydroperoxide resistance regulator
MDDSAAALAMTDQPKTKVNPLNALPYLLDTSIAKWNLRLGQRLEPIGLTFEQWRVLLVTAQRGPMNIRELSNATLVPHSTIGRWLTQMEKEGLVKRRALPRDQRAVEISITQKGRNLFLRALPIARLEYESAVQEFTPGELDMLMSLLQRLKDNLED